MAGVSLWSPGKDCHIGLTSGHTFVVPSDKAGIEVPARFRKEAIARGCLPVGMEPDEEGPSAFDRAKVIRDNIQKMLESVEEGMFTRDGKPNLTKLSALCGFTLDRGEVNRVWDQMNNAMGDDDDDKPTMLSVGAGTEK